MRVYYSQPTIQITSQCSAITSMFMADNLSNDTVKLHKTEECILIYNFNFLHFTFFFQQIFYYYYQGLVKPYLDLAESIAYLVFLRNDLSFCNVFRVLGFSMFNFFFSFSIGEAGFKMLSL